MRGPTREQQNKNLNTALLPFLNKAHTTPNEGLSLKSSLNSFNREFK